MITIAQEPDSYNYSLNLPNLRFRSDRPTIGLKMELGGSLLLQEEYNAPPQGGFLNIHIKHLAHSFMGFTVPTYTDQITVHDTAIQDLKLTFTDGEEEIIRSYKILKGYLHTSIKDITSYFRNFWLNLTPQHSHAYYHQPLYLTALPLEEESIRIRARMVDGSEVVKTLGKLEANKLQSINLNPGKMIYHLGGDYVYFEAFTVNTKGQEVRFKRFYFKEHYEFQSDVFFYQNRLGGWDTLVLNGEMLIRHKNVAQTAIIEEIEHEYYNELGIEFEKNSGYMSTRDDHRQYLDFLASKTRYYLYQGNLVPIVMTENKAEEIKGGLNGHTFSFRLADTSQYHSEIGATPQYLTIT